MYGLDFDEMIHFITSLPFGLQFQGGGNAGNVAVAVRRLGKHEDIYVKVLTKIGSDDYGRKICKDFGDEDISIDDIVIDDIDSTPFTYVIVSEDDNTRTCIHHPLNIPLNENDFKDTWLLNYNLCKPVDLLFLDSRHHEGAIKAAIEARKLRIPILLDIEKIR